MPRCSPLDRQAVFTLIRDRLADILEIEPSAISEGASFTDDLDADSLALIELVEAIEEEMGERTAGFRIEDEDLEDLKTVRDAVDYVVERAGGRFEVLSHSDQLEALVERLGRPFARPELLARALCHRSWCAESPGELSNERLEFLGDSVLGLVVTDYLYRTYPDLPEGQLAQVRAAVVNAERAGRGRGRAATWARRCAWARARTRPGGREKPSILSDAMEAVIGAVYLDGGWDDASTLVMDLLGERMTEAAAGPGGHDFKTRLQELAARRFDELPSLLRCRPRAPTTPSASPPGCRSGGQESARARAARRSRPSRPRPAWPGAPVGADHDPGRRRRRSSTSRCWPSDLADPEADADA